MSAEKAMVVAVRVRPLSTKEVEQGAKSCCQIINNTVIAIKKEGTGGYLKSEQAIINEYAFDACFDECSSQAEVYEQTAKPFLPNLLKGLNVTVFCYGATGSGKTHTMLGNTRQDDAASSCEAGIIPNAVSDLFQLLQSASSRCSFGEKWVLNMTYIEVYNEQVYDLLDSSGKTLALREDPEKGQVTIAGVTEQCVNSYQDVIDFLVAGNKNRRTEATNANSVSSRSHAVLQLTLQHVTRTSSGRDSVVESKLSLIDLAGSERASATNNTGVRLQEGANINKSLLSLANCINALSSRGSGGGSKNVKYRDSKLTHLLKSSLEGNCNLVMIANVNPSHFTYEDSHNTIKYANRSKSIKVNPTMKENTKELSWVEREAKLKQENEFLKQRVSELENIIVQLKRALPAGFSLSNQIKDLGICEDMASDVDDRPQEPIKLSTGKSARSTRGKKGLTASEPASCVSVPRSVLPPIQESSDRSRFSLGSEFDPLGSSYANMLSDSILEDGLFHCSEPPTPIAPVVEEKVVSTVASRKGKRGREAQVSANSTRGSGSRKDMIQPSPAVVAASSHVSLPVVAPVDNVFLSLLTEDENPLNVSIEAMYPAAKRRRSQIPIARKNQAVVPSNSSKSSKSRNTASVPEDAEFSENLDPQQHENMWEDPVDVESQPVITKKVPASEPVALSSRSSKGTAPIGSRRQSLAQVSMMLQALSDPLTTEDSGITTRARRVSVSSVAAPSPAVVAANASTSRRRSSVARRLM